MNGCGQDGFGPDIVGDGDQSDDITENSVIETKSVSLIDSSCDTWLNIRKFSNQARQGVQNKLVPSMQA